MCNWPERYDLYHYYDNGYIGLAPNGDYVKHEDFDRALSVCAGLISTIPQFETMHPQTVKEYLITEIKKDI